MLWFYALRVSLTAMPLHKSSRAPRLDPTMISAPLGDFRHTMHIGRGGDAFGDTSFLSKVDPSSATPDQPAAEPELAVNHSGLHTDVPGSPEDNQLKRSDSESSLTLDLDLDLDLGPSMLGDVLGVMDGLAYRCAPRPGTGPVCGPEVGDLGFNGNSEHIKNNELGTPKTSRGVVLNQTPICDALRMRICRSSRLEPDVSPDEENKDVRGIIHLQVEASE
uniref:CDC42 effector protein (Rho GTPase binding) 5 n=1 Tax=Oryzias melastigma TaxID=30732 RepID=A0A3B3BUS3_ORYME